MEKLAKKPFPMMLTNGDEYGKLEKWKLNQEEKLNKTNFDQFAKFRSPIPSAYSVTTNAKKSNTQSNKMKHQNSVTNRIQNKEIPMINNFTHPELFSSPKKVNPPTVNQMKTKKQRSRSSYFKLGTVTAIGSLFMFLAYDPMVESLISYNLVLRPNGLTTQVWLRNPIPLHSCWTLFGVTNGKEFVAGEKAHLKEYGPFCYDIYRQRRTLEWKAKTVVFMEKFEFVFNREDSISRDTSIPMINLPILAAVNTVKYLMTQFYVSFLGPIVYNAITLALSNTGQELVTVVTARQLMEGWELDLIRYIDNILIPFRTLGLPMPSFKKGFLGIVENSFGITTSVSWFELGPFEAYVKHEDGHYMGQVIRYDDLYKYPYYDPPCNQLGGSDGLFHPRHMAPKQLQIYLHHLCRLVKFNHNGTHLFQGVKTDRYNLDKHMFDMSLKRNRCFCKDRPWKECDGYTAMTPCAFGLPLGLSYPHFLYSPRRQQEFIGLKPDPQIHYGSLEFDPQFGTPVNLELKLQGVLLIEPIWSVPMLMNIPKVALPVAWINVYVGATGAVLGTLLFIGSNAVRFGSYGFLMGGFGLSGLLFTRGVLKKSQPTMNQQSSKGRMKSMTARNEPTQYAQKPTNQTYHTQVYSSY